MDWMKGSRGPRLLTRSTEPISAWEKKTNEKRALGLCQVPRIFEGGVSREGDTFRRVW